MSYLRGCATLLPVYKMALVAYDSSGEESDGGQPPESLRSKERDQKSMLSAYVFAPSGPGKKGQRKVVRIGLPELAGQVRLFCLRY